MALEMLSTLVTFDIENGTHVVKSLSPAIAAFLDKPSPEVTVRTVQRVSRKMTQFYDNET
jgi:hypothetical protein